MRESLLLSISFQLDGKRQPLPLSISFQLDGKSQSAMTEPERKIAELLENGNYGFWRNDVWVAYLE